MALNTGKKITRRSWDVIPMPDKVIARVNALATDQPEQLIFTDRCGRLIGDVEIPGVMDFEEEDNDNAVMPVLDPVGIDGVELPRVDIAGQATQTIEIDDLDIPQPDPPLIKMVEEPTVPQMEQDEPTQIAQPMQTAGLRRSMRVKIQPKLYEPTMTGSKYSYAVTQLETHGVLHPDSHMFIQEDLTEITQPCVHTCDGLFICQLYLLPDLLEDTDCKEDTPLTLPFASFVSLSQLIIVI
jgi:hypothetical protein